MDSPTEDDIPPYISEAITVLLDYVNKFAADKGKTPEEFLGGLLKIDSYLLSSKVRGHNPYYKEKFALKFKCELDTMFADGCNRILVAKNFGVTVNTLHCMVTQGILFLIEKMDDEKKTYATIRERIEIEKFPMHLKLSWKSKKAMSKDFEEATGISEEINHAPDFKEALHEWLETGEDESKFERTGLHLADDQLEYIKDACNGVDNIFIHTLNFSHLLIMRSSTAAAFMKKGNG